MPVLGLKFDCASGQKWTKRPQKSQHWRKSAQNRCCSISSLCSLLFFRHCNAPFLRHYVWGRLVWSLIIKNGEKIFSHIWHRFLAWTVPIVHSKRSLHNRIGLDLCCRGETERDLATVPLKSADSYWLASPTAIVGFSSHRTPLRVQWPQQWQDVQYGRKQGEENSFDARHDLLGFDSSCG